MTYRERLRLIRARIALHQRQALAQDRVRPHREHGRAGRLVVGGLGLLALVMLVCWQADAPVWWDTSLIETVTLLAVVVGALWRA